VLMIRRPLTVRIGRRVAVLMAVLLVTWSTPVASAQPGRYCQDPGRGWYCLYADAWWGGNSIGKSACGYTVLPEWFQYQTTSYNDNQYGDSGLFVALHREHQKEIFRFNLGEQDNLPWWDNDLTVSTYNSC